MGDSTAGWQADPTGRFEHRYWDGSAWTDNVSNAGVMSTDPFEPDREAAALDATTEQPALSTDPTTQQPVAASETTATWPAAPAAPPPPTYVAPPLGAAGGPPSPDPRSNRRVLIGGGILAVVAIVVAALLLGGGSSDTSDTTEAVQPNGTTETTDEDILGGGSLPPDFEEQMAQIYEDSLGLPADKAACLAGKMADAVTSGDLTQDEAMSDVFSYLSDCDIDLSEITGN